MDLGPTPFVTLGMASAQGTERLGKLCALPFVGSQPPCWFGPTQAGSPELSTLRRSGPNQMRWRR